MNAPGPFLPQDPLKCFPPDFFRARSLTRLGIVKCSERLCGFPAFYFSMALNLFNILNTLITLVFSFVLFCLPPLLPTAHTHKSKIHEGRIFSCLVQYCVPCTQDRLAHMLE